MDENKLKFRLGAVTFATIIFSVIMILLFSKPESLWRGSYTVKIPFDRAPGVMEETPVRKGGVLIGRVKAITFPEPEDGGGVMVTLWIYGDVKLRRTERCRINTSLLGEAVLEFVPGDGLTPPNETPRPGDSPSDESAALKPAADMQAGITPVSGQPTSGGATGDQAKYFQDGEELPKGVVYADPMEVLTELQPDLSSTVTSLGKAGDEVGKLAESINKLLTDNDDRLERILTKTEAALDGFQRASETMDAIFGDEQVRENLKLALEELPQLMNETQETVAGMQRAVQSAEVNLQNLEGLTGPLGQRGPQLVETVESTVGQLDELLEQLVTLTEAVNNQEGSLGQLLYNPDLYQNLNQAALNIEKISHRLRPIVEDVRAFTDKIARDPGRLGVSGALRRESGIK